MARFCEMLVCSNYAQTKAGINRLVFGIALNRVHKRNTLQTKERKATSLEVATFLSGFICSGYI